MPGTTRAPGSHEGGVCSDSTLTVLIHSGCYNKIPETGWLINRYFFLTVLEAGSPRSRHQQIQSLVRTCFLIHRHNSSHCVLTWQKGIRELSGVSFIRVLIPFMRAPPLWPNHLPKAIPPNTLGVRFQHRNFGGMQTFSSQEWSCCTSG